MPTNQPENGTLKLSEMSLYALILGVLIQKLVRLFPQVASVAVSVVFPQRSEKKQHFPRLSMKMLCSR